jgi:dTDP-4-dehydrorhamnose 3,5-epimerase-like enzyme
MTKYSISKRFESFLGGKVLLIEIDAVEDARGTLSPFNFTEISFAPKQVAIINSFDGVSRGEHAHKSGKQALICVSGAVTLDLKHGSDEAQVRLEAGRNAAVIESPVWCRQIYHGKSPSLMVFSDVLYDPDNYVQNP